MRITVIANGESFGGVLYEHPVADEFAALLPIELSFKDFNAVEKLASLGHSLTLRGVPTADEQAAGEQTGQRGGKSRTNDDVHHALLCGRDFRRPT